MPKGHHYRQQTRSYTSAYARIAAVAFKGLIESQQGAYIISSSNLSKDHSHFKLIKSKLWQRIMLFTIQGREVPVPIKTDSRSASNKTYLVCPYCTCQRQHLYAVKSTYACRKCLNLNYASQSEREQDRLARRIRKQRSNLWGNNYPDINNLIADIYIWTKPKWMRWKKFERKRKDIIDLEQRYWILADAQIKSLLDDLR